MTKCLQEEEKLTVCVLGYPAQCNKVEPSFHNKKKKQNSWGKIANELQLGSWKEAKLAFTSMRSNITDARRISRTVIVLKHPLTECKRPKRT